MGPVVVGLGKPGACGPLPPIGVTDEFEPKPLDGKPLDGKPLDGAVEPKPLDGGVTPGPYTFCEPEPLLRPLPLLAEGGVKFEYGVAAPPPEEPATFWEEAGVVMRE